MDNKRIENGNKLILLFMGGVVGSSTKYPTGEIIIHSIHFGDKQINDFINETKYHKSWDWLMPVAKRLNDVSRVEPVSFTKNILDFDIEKVYDAVYDYIGWFNKNINDNKQSDICQCGSEIPENDPYDGYCVDCG